MFVNVCIKDNSRPPWPERHPAVHTKLVGRHRFLSHPYRSSLSHLGAVSSLVRMLDLAHTPSVVLVGPCQTFGSESIMLCPTEIIPVFYFSSPDELLVVYRLYFRGIHLGLAHYIVGSVPLPRKISVY